MRIWSYDLIPVLPKKQLMAMRYELGDIIKQYPNIKHGLVKFANNYDVKYLYSYFEDVLDELDKRNINHTEKYDTEIYKTVNQKTKFQFNYLNLYFEEDNDRYLRECLYNLEEKATRNMISKEEWQKIYYKFKDKFDLWDGEDNGRK